MVLAAGESRRQDATLLVAAATPVTIEVVGSLVSTDTSQASTVFTQRQMEQLPMSLGIQGRNLRNQMFLAPGVAPTTQPHRPFAVAGARTRNNNFLIDSNDFNEIQGGLLPGRGPSEQMIPSESIESMQVLTHNFKLSTDAKTARW